METSLLAKTQIITVMKKSHKTKLFDILKNFKLLGFGLLTIVILIIYIKSSSINRVGPDSPSPEEQAQIIEYFEKCPLDKVVSNLEHNESALFYIGKIRCSENQHPDFYLPTKGEEAEVEIYTEDLEYGKQYFRKWLKLKGLEEGSLLRFKYIHIPKIPARIPPAVISEEQLN